MYSKSVDFQIHQKKTDEKQRKLVKIYFHFSALIAHAMSQQRALKYTHGQIVDTKLANQSARFTQVEL